MSHPDPLARLAWAYSHALPGTATAVLAYLAFKDGEKGCFPSVATICKDTGFRRTAVHTALRLLEDACLIEVSTTFTGNRQTSNTYAMDYMHMRTGQAAHGRGPADGPVRETDPRGPRGERGGVRETDTEHEEELEMKHGRSSFIDVDEEGINEVVDTEASAVAVASSGSVGGSPGEERLRLSVVGHGGLSGAGPVEDTTDTDDGAEVVSLYEERMPTDPLACVAGDDGQIHWRVSR